MSTEDAARGEEKEMMGWYGGGMGAGMWIVMGLFWVALIAVVIWLVIRLLPAHRDANTTTAVPTTPLRLPAQESPTEILDRRLARGEIDLETYQIHRAALIAARGGR